MEQYCTNCRQTQASEATHCPECGNVLVPRKLADQRNGQKLDATPLPSPLHPQTSNECAQPAHSEHEIDLGSPVSAGQPGSGGPPSGASFVSWSAMLERKQQQQQQPKPASEGAVQFDPPSAARLRLDQGRLLSCSADPDSDSGAARNDSPAPAQKGAVGTGPEPAPEAEIDLGRPVTERSGDSGPLSGASGVGWAALLRARKQYEDPNNPTLDYHNPQSAHSPRAAAVPASSPLPKAPSQRPPLEPRSVLVGFLLGLAVCLLLWALGLLPAHPRQIPASPAGIETQN